MSVRPDVSTVEIVARYEHGQSSKTIAKALACSDTTVRKRLHSVGIAPRPFGKVPREWTLYRLQARSRITDRGCREWQGATSHGYGVVQIGSTRDGSRRTENVHQLAWTLTFGNHPCLRGPMLQGTCVLHRCDNRRCWWPEHLFLGTIADNNADMRAKGRHKGGPNAPHWRTCVDRPQKRGRG